MYLRVKADSFFCVLAVFPSFCISWRSLCRLEVDESLFVASQTPSIRDFLIPKLNKVPCLLFILKFKSVGLLNFKKSLQSVFETNTHLLTYLLTYSMVQSPSWEANWFAASREIPRISQNLKVHYRTHKHPPPVSILGQPYPVHIPTSHLLEIHPNIIHPSTPRSLQWSLSLRFPHQDPVHLLSSPIRATCPAHLILLDFIIRTILGEEYKSHTLQ